MEYIGLHDAESEHIRNKKFPNYALMKLSAWHKGKGNEVSWWLPLYGYDRVYSSKIFDFTPENGYLPENTQKGGTGYSISKKLPEEVDSMFPDYTIYPECDYATGFLTRGCPNQCEWCYVPEKEGQVHPYRTWKELVRMDTDKLVLMDNNILASPFGIRQLEELATKKYKIDLNQGMDIRLVTPELVRLFSKLHWSRYIRFSCDTVSQLPYFQKVVPWFQKYGISLSRVFVYVLVRKDLEEADYRVQELYHLGRNINLYAQAERNGKLGIVPDRLQLEFAQRYVYGRVYKKENWEGYCQRRGFVAPLDRLSESEKPEYG